MCWEKGHGNAGARQAGRRQGDDDGQAADDLHHMTAPDQSPVGFRNCLRRCRDVSIARSHAQLLRLTIAHCGRGGGEEDVSKPFRPCRLRLQQRPHMRYSKTAAACHKCHPEAEEWASFVPEAMPTMRALTPQSVQTISLSGPTVKPCDRLLIVVSKFPLSFSSHVAEPFSAHSGHVTDVTNRSRLSITASRLRA